MSCSLIEQSEDRSSTGRTCLCYRYVQVGYSLQACGALAAGKYIPGSVQELATAAASPVLRLSPGVRCSHRPGQHVTDTT